MSNCADSESLYNSEEYKEFKRMQKQQKQQNMVSLIAPKDNNLIKSSDGHVYMRFKGSVRRVTNKMSELTNYNKIDKVTSRCHIQEALITNNKELAQELIPVN